MVLNEGKICCVCHSCISWHIEGHYCIPLVKKGLVIVHNKAKADPILLGYATCQQNNPCTHGGHSGHDKDYDSGCFGRLGGWANHTTTTPTVAPSPASVLAPTPFDSLLTMLYHWIGLFPHMLPQ